MINFSFPFLNLIGRPQVAKSNTLDYETGPQYFDIKVRTTDSGSGPLSAAFTLRIFVQDVPEPPTNLKLSAANLKDGSPVGTVIGQVTAFDPDRWQTVKFSLVDSEQGRFALNAKNQVVVGKVTRCTPHLTYRITVKATDSGSPALSVSKVISETSGPSPFA